MAPEPGIDTVEKFAALLARDRAAAVLTLIAEYYVDGELTTTYDDLVELHLGTGRPFSDRSDDELVALYAHELALQPRTDDEDDEDDEDEEDEEDDIDALILRATADEQDPVARWKLFVCYDQVPHDLDCPTRVRPAATCVCVKSYIPSWYDADTPRFECQNCAMHWPEELLNPVKDVFQRVAPGEPMPAGECPDCGAVCHKVRGDCR